MFHSSHLQFRKKWSLNRAKSTFSIFFVIEIATFISNFQSRIDIGTFLNIPKIIFHLSIIFVPVGVLDSSFDKLVILKPALKLRSVCQFQITPPRSIIPGPLSIVSAPIERKEPIPFLFFILPFPIIVFLRRIAVIPISVLHAAGPASLIHDFSGPQIDNSAVSMLPSISKLAFVDEIVFLEKVICHSMVFAVVYLPIIDVPVREIDCLRTFFFADLDYLF